ncbi:MAG: hypothetical protein P0Y59_08155 [Candidatus Sphingomonas phytovorans]|nr:hypothetical protein [Sphingomonas sp.]WEK01631.1 MAG: hypothetical protein P0Y59_08155 [Sphingomonas sp.]
MLALPAAALPADPVERAMAAIGGRGLIERVRAIRWIGTGKLHVGGKTVELGMETHLEPFVRARSDSWLLSDGRSAMRTLMIEGDRGFAVIEGKQSALSPLATLNERQQFGAYGYMLMAGARWEALPRGALRGTRPGFPSIDVRLEKDGRMLSADYILSPPDDPGTEGKPVHEYLGFAGTVADKGVRWPQRLAIARDNRPFFSLSIDHFSVDLR